MLVRMETLRIKSFHVVLAAGIFFAATLRGGNAFMVNLPMTRSTAPRLEPKQSQLFYHSLDDENEFLYYQQAPATDEERYRQEMFNQFLVASRDSFKNVERGTDFLLEERPLVALLIFVGAGLLVAYISGFFILGGYIDSINPAANNAVPYWD